MDALDSLWLASTGLTEQEHFPHSTASAAGTLNARLTQSQQSRFCVTKYLSISICASPCEIRKTLRDVSANQLIRRSRHCGPEELADLFRKNAHKCACITECVHVPVKHSVSRHPGVSWSAEQQPRGRTDNLPPARHACAGSPGYAATGLSLLICSSSGKEFCGSGDGRRGSWTRGAAASDPTGKPEQWNPLVVTSHLLATFYLGLPI